MNRSAFCVGINEYPGTGLDLAGCVNDAIDLSEALLARKFVVTTLLDAGATKANILETLRTTLTNARFGDRVVFTFSGHGTWLPDVDGDEADGRDEALVPHDFDTAGVILDDEIHAVLEQRRFGVRVTVISDSCHSGTVTRALVARDVRGAPRFLPPAAFIPDRQLLAAERVQDSQLRSAPRAGAILLSGCADPEYSYDAWFGPPGAERPNGAFTRAALNTLAPAGAPQSVQAWHRAIRARLPSIDYPQTPQLVASRYQRHTRALS